MIDFVAGDVADLLAQADGRTVQVGERNVTLQLQGPSCAITRRVHARASWPIITNPTIAYLLLLAGIFGLLLEATHPGAILPGVVGGICLLIALVCACSCCR